MKLAEIGKRIHAHLKRFEADPAINTSPNGQTTRRFFHAGAHATGRWVSVGYISYQGDRSLSKADALAYLEWLDAGNVGKHYEALRQKRSEEAASDPAIVKPSVTTPETGSAT